MPRPANAPTRPEPPVPPERALQVITAEYDRNADSFARMLPDTSDPTRFRELFLQEVTRDPKLLRCAPASLIRATFDMAKLGLEPVLGEAYLVPFWNTKASVYNATLIIGYHGLQTLAYNSGFVTMIEGEVVREADEWTYVRGYPESTLRHVPAKGDRGEIMGAWAMVHLRGIDRPLVGYLPLDRVEQRRLVSRSGTDKDTGQAIGIWREWREEMFLKTALRFTLNLAPKAVRARVAQALDLEDAVDALLRVETDPARQLASGKGSTPRRRRLLARLSGAQAPADEVEGESKDLPAGDAGTAVPSAGREATNMRTDGQAPVLGRSRGEEGEWHEPDGGASSRNAVTGPTDQGDTARPVSSDGRDRSPTASSTRAATSGSGSEPNDDSNTGSFSNERSGDLSGEAKASTIGTESETTTDPRTSNYGSDRSGPESERPTSSARTADAPIPDVCGAPDQSGDMICGLRPGHLDDPRAARVHRKLDATGKVLANWPADPPAGHAPDAVEPE